jgi:hypothetical protein
MATYNTLEQRILEKIRQLPHEKVIEVEDFIDFLNQRNADRSLALAATKLAESALEKIWDNPEDAVYDDL